MRSLSLLTFPYYISRSLAHNARKLKACEIGKHSPETSLQMKMAFSHAGWRRKTVNNKCKYLQTLNLSKNTVNKQAHHLAIMHIFTIGPCVFEMAKQS